ncbi:MAG: ketopantoate reductase family protein [Promethearchaeota archaeon]
MIMGAGAIGSLFGGFLMHIGNEVSLIGRKLHVDKINQDGLVIDGVSGEYQIHIKATIDPSSLKAPDLIILTVKAYDTAQAVKDVKPLVESHTHLLCLQNGLGTEDVAGSIVGNEHIIRGTTSNGALFLEPGKIRHTGHGDTVIGYPDRKPDLFLKQLAAIFQKAGFNTTISDNIKKLVWQKIFVNVAINPFGTLTGLRNGDLLTIPQLKETMVAAVTEGIGVTDKLGLNINRQMAIDKAFEVAQRTAMNKNSMLQDIEKGKKTEIDFINGALVKYGEENGQPCPINTVLTALVKGLEKRNELMRFEVN